MTSQPRDYTKLCEYINSIHPNKDTECKFDNETGFIHYLIHRDKLSSAFIFDTRNENKVIRVPDLWNNVSFPPTIQPFQRIKQIHQEVCNLTFTSYDKLRLPLLDDYAVVDHLKDVLPKSECWIAYEKNEYISLDIEPKDTRNIISFKIQPVSFASYYITSPIPWILEVRLENFISNVEAVIELERWLGPDGLIYKKSLEKLKAKYERETEYLTLNWNTKPLCPR